MKKIKDFRSFAGEIGLATKTQRHEIEKMLRIFPLCLSALVAKLNFCKKLFLRGLYNV